ncbi:BA14K family protein [Agrobacterium cavarae]|uniref:BA14K family protein n=1 Tax=Agrobacterium cavarae TaxID=2528239 RepID=UPI0028A80C95|nr:BA14K family protein [Agrobacterium cavarae]
MSRSGKAKSVIFLAAAFMCAASGPSFALSVINPAYVNEASAGEATNASVSAFSNGGATKGSGDLLLSAEEVQHIRWCATRYPSYHASDNTFANASGARTECRSK